jgi:hypothetical protein
LLGTCHFDRGFYAAFIVEALAQLSRETPASEHDLILLVDPASALVDAGLIDELVEHARGHSHREFFFTQAAAGLAGVLLKPALLDRLAKANAHPGRELAYSPDLPGLDPVTNDMCLAVPAVIARTLHRFALDSDRQVRRFEAATADLNGHLMVSDAEKLVAVLDAYPPVDPYPREVVLEVTTQRASKPIFAAGTHLELGRGEMEISAIEATIQQLREIDDLRLTLAGAGDALLHSRFGEMMKLIADAQIPAVHVETDLLEISDAAMETLAQGGIDILTVHLPAITPATYQRIMGVDGYARAIANLKRLLAKKSTLPIIVPTFVKCRENQAEMETWYDHWIRILGTAVIVGPSDYAGQIPDVAVADMSPPKRRPCARLRSRMTVLSDARIVSCEQDVLGKQAMGCMNSDGVKEVWREGFAALRREHEANCFDARPVCGACREWHRP